MRSRAGDESEALVVVGTASWPQVNVLLQRLSLEAVVTLDALLMRLAGHRTAASLCN